jgi:hypothetical protein
MMRVPFYVLHLLIVAGGGAAIGEIGYRLDLPLWLSIIAVSAWALLYTDT